MDMKKDTKWKSAEAVRFLVVLAAAAFVASGLYKTGVVSGDVLGSGVRSMLHSMEAGLGSSGGQAWMWWSSSSSASTTEQQQQATLPCFKDSPMENQDYYEVEVVSYCADPLTVFRLCPWGALCTGGAIEHCNRDSQHFEVSAAGDQCVLTAAWTATIQKFEQKLIEWTIQDGCTREKCAHKRMDEDGSNMRPLFEFTFKHRNWDMKLLEGANAARFAVTGKHVFLTLHENDTLLIGLHPDQDLPLPFSCLFSGVLQWLFHVVTWLFHVVTDFFFTFPNVSGLLFHVSKRICKIRSGQRSKQQLLSDVVECRNKAYRTLADRQEHETIHIRDQISFQVCPTSKVGRKRIQTVVWPRVVGDIGHDKRIHKRVVAVAATAAGASGEKREYWKWVDAADYPAPGHVRFSTTSGASGSGNGSGNGNTSTVNGQ
jgi:hypothetical protein